MKELKELYKKHFGVEPLQVDSITDGGSNRHYYRMTGPDGASVVGVVGTSLDENRAFVTLAKHFTLRRLPVPEVLAVSRDGSRYLQTDLGSRSLFGALETGRKAGGRYTEEEKNLLRRTIAELPNIQVRGARGLDWSVCYPQPEMDKQTVLFDLNYFKYCFLKATGIDFHELKLEANFQLMANDLTAECTDTFMVRDFQARNVMLTEAGEPRFIDFQGGRRGPLQYDVASFLWQASARYSSELRQELVGVYLQSLKQYMEVNERKFRQQLNLFVLFRILQVLGAYGFRGYFERKKHFLESIPPAMQNLRELLEAGAVPYTYLAEVLKQMVSLPQFAEPQSEPVQRTDGYKTTAVNVYKTNAQDGPATFSKYDGKGPLTVKVFSFSYHKGIPEDTSGNGGGYVFDCRSTHNPGRYEPYKKLTGRDEPVIRFLEDDGEILTFLDSVYKLADAHTERYIQRGFTSLMFCFGCTGGQHRSVYSAQHLAEHLNKKYGVRVELCHREQQISEVLEARTQEGGRA